MIRVKVCGIQREEDALLAAELGAWAIGFIFWPASARYIAPERAAKIVKALPLSVTPIGVFVDQSEGEVRAVADAVKVGAVQLHGNEPPESYEGWPYPVIKSVAVSERFDPRAVDHVPASATVLLDAHDPVRHGGTGRTIDWTVAAQAARSRPIILSGGLGAGNVRSAVDTVHPHAVDVSSGVEASPGVKDPEKLRAFFAALQC
jgi:phosphoribosylanthranilate isomerase